MSATEIINSGLFEAAVMLMDDDIREELNGEISPCSEYEFLITYMERHAERYGIDFIIETTRRIHHENQY